MMRSAKRRVEAADNSGNPQGRRERKKALTRAALVEAAMTLFQVRGYDGVTVADIAEAADVDPTTFFRHFKSKESVLFADSDEIISHYREAIDSRPLDEPILTAGIEATRSLFGRFDREVDRFRTRLVAETLAPEVAAYVLAFESRATRELQDALAARMGVSPEKDPRPYLLASTIMAAGQWFRLTSKSAKRQRSVAQFAEQVSEVIASVIPLFEEARRAK